jgi:hypothetical protein
MKKPKIIPVIERNKPRPDVVKLCNNCEEIYTTHLLQCPVCRSGQAKRKRVHFCIDNLQEFIFPVLSVSKTILINRFVPHSEVIDLHDGQIIEIADQVRQYIHQNLDDFYLKGYRQWLDKKLKYV